MAALACSYLRSGASTALSPRTQKARRYLIERLVADYGDWLVDELERRHIKRMMDRMASTPGTARNVLSVIRILMALAVEEGLRTDNPAVGIKRPKLSPRVGTLGMRTRSPNTSCATLSVHKPGWR